MKRHVGAYGKNALVMGAQMHQADAGNNLVRAALQPGQHPPGIRQIARLAKNFAIKKYKRIGAEHECVGNFFGHGTGLAVGVELADLKRGKVLVRDFVGFAGQNAKFYLQKFEEFSAAR